MWKPPVNEGAKVIQVCIAVIAPTCTPAGVRLSCRRILKRVHFYVSREPLQHARAVVTTENIYGNLGSYVLLWSRYAGRRSAHCIIFGLVRPRARVGVVFPRRSVSSLFFVCLSFVSSSCSLRYLKNTTWSECQFYVKPFAIWVNDGLRISSVSLAHVLLSITKKTIAE